MEIFSKDQKIAHVIRANIHLLPVLNRFGIRLGVKDKTIEEICAAYKIDPAFLLAIINTYHNAEYFPEDYLQSFSPKLIVEYLRKTHLHYIGYELPKIEGLLDQLINSCTHNCSDLQTIKSFYRKYKEELLHHIDDEEHKLFPYAIQLVDNPSTINKYISETFKQEHSNVDEKLIDLKNLIIKYLQPSYNDNACNEFLHALFQFEKDIYDHARIEDAILIPQLEQIENQNRA